MANNQTFPLANITSVTPIEIPASMGWATLLLMCGIVVSMGGVGAAGLSSVGIAYGLVGLAMVAGGIVLLVRRKPTYEILLRTAGGDVTACRSRDRDFITRIVEALNEAIVARG